MAGDAAAEPGLGGESELALADEDVFGAHASGDAVEPAAAGEIGHRNLGVAQSLHRLGGELDVAEQRDMGDVVQPHNFLLPARAQYRSD